MMVWKGFIQNLCWGGGAKITLWYYCGAVWKRVSATPKEPFLELS